MYAMQLRTYHYGHKIPLDSFVIIRTGSVKIVKLFKAKPENKLADRSVIASHHHHHHSYPHGHSSRQQSRFVGGIRELDISILGVGDFFGGQRVSGSCSSINSGSKKKLPQPDVVDRTERTRSTLAMFDQPNHFQAVAIAETVEVLILTKEKYLSFLQTSKSTYSNQEFVRCMQDAVSQVMADRMKRADAKLLMFEQITVGGSMLNTRSSQNYSPDIRTQQHKPPVVSSEEQREPLDGFVSSATTTVVNEADCGGGYIGAKATKSSSSSLASPFSQTGGRTGRCFVSISKKPANDGTSQQPQQQQQQQHPRRLGKNHDELLQHPRRPPETNITTGSTDMHPHHHGLFLLESQACVTTDPNDASILDTDPHMVPRP
jgi:CRP-like cAMP-binding protein